METTNNSFNNNTYNISNGVYEIVRIFDNKKSIKDIILETIAKENKRQYS